ncbi:hypothetical protein L1049_009861 [Liquidambar formosana]|uniref:Ubiquinol oxidase n=1 Tax=Liquidambar formosana TaxID=63359 RepID=A0AAP0R3T3_LIQFO
MQEIAATQLASAPQTLSVSITSVLLTLLLLRINGFPGSCIESKQQLCKITEEKVVVEESFQAKSFPDDEGEGSRGEPRRVHLPVFWRHGQLSLNNPLIFFSRSLEITYTFRVIIDEVGKLLLMDSVIKILDTLYHDRNYPRFYVLETIARVPYFAFISVLHLYESFGWWRKADYLKVHFAESWNEMHHLLIMEELGGDAWWVDRFLAQHIAVFYYFMTVFMYMISPRMAYHFSECVEHHAYSTYDKFIMDQGGKVKSLKC